MKFPANFPSFPVLDSLSKENKDKLKRSVYGGGLLSGSFYLFQLAYQRIYYGLKIHVGLSPLIVLPIGLLTTTTSLLLAQSFEYVIREETYNYQRIPDIQTVWDHRKSKSLHKKGASVDYVKEQLTRVTIGLGIFLLLERSLFRTALPSSVILPGVYTNAFNRFRRSIPATSAIVSEVQRRRIQSLGKRYGCHQCGDRQWFSKDFFIGDHMPPTKFAKEMSEVFWRRWLQWGVQQRLWAQCRRCWQLQGSAVRANIHRPVKHLLFRKHHLAPLLTHLLLLYQPETIKKIEEALMEPIAQRITKDINKQLRQKDGSYRSDKDHGK